MDFQEYLNKSGFVGSVMEAENIINCHVDLMLVGYDNLKILSNFCRYVLEERLEEDDPDYSILYDRLTGFMAKAYSLLLN